PDHIIIQRLADLAGGGDFTVLLPSKAALRLFADDVVAQLHAFIADEHGGAGNQLAHLMLRFAAEAAVQGAFAVGSAQFRHALVLSRHGPCRGIATATLDAASAISKQPG